MSILIEGMEMPQKCGQCKLYHAEHPMHCMAVEGHRTVGAPYGMPRPDWCPLVEVPTPHGRLIDADRLDCLSWYDTGGCFEDGVLWVVNKIDELPSIIEAEGSEK